MTTGLTKVSSPTSVRRSWCFPFNEFIYFPFDGRLYLNWHSSGLLLSDLHVVFELDVIMEVMDGAISLKELVKLTLTRSLRAAFSGSSGFGESFCEFMTSSEGSPSVGLSEMRLFTSSVSVTWNFGLHGQRAERFLLFGVRRTRICPVPFRKEFLLFYVFRRGFDSPLD